MTAYSSAAELIDSVATAPAAAQLSEWLQIDQPMIAAFADATNDHQWIHVDEERALTGPFGATIAHGHLILSLLPSLTAGVVTLEGAKMGINYGLDRVRFLQPVLVGSWIRASTAVASASQVSTGVRVVLHVTVEIRGADKPALIAETIALYVLD